MNPVSNLVGQIFGIYRVYIYIYIYIYSVNRRSIGPRRFHASFETRISNLVCGKRLE